MVIREFKENPVQAGGGVMVNYVARCLCGAKECVVG